MASEGEVDPQSFDDSAEKENVSVNVLIAVIIGVITAGKNLSTIMV